MTLLYYYMGGAFKYLLFSPRSLGEGSNLTNFFNWVETINYIGPFFICIACNPFFYHLDLLGGSSHDL